MGLQAGNVGLDITTAAITSICGSRPMAAVVM
jgi:hypothetical protein